MKKEYNDKAFRHDEIKEFEKFITTYLKSIDHHKVALGKNITIHKIVFEVELVPVLILERIPTADQKYNYACQYLDKRYLKSKIKDYYIKEGRQRTIEMYGKNFNTDTGIVCMPLYEMIKLGIAQIEKENKWFADQYDYEFSIKEFDNKLTPQG